jgi:hypothetical protein
LLLRHGAALGGAGRRGGGAGRRGAALGATDREGNTVLHAAAYARSASVVRFLIGKKLEVNAKSRAGRTPLHLAADAGHKGAVELLIAAGAGVSTADQVGFTPLTEAVRAEGRRPGAGEVVRLLPDHKADPNEGAGTCRSIPLTGAAAWGNREMAELLIARGADVNARAPDGAYGPVPRGLQPPGGDGRIPRRQGGGRERRRRRRPEPPGLCGGAGKGRGGRRPAEARGA